LFFTIIQRALAVFRVTRRKYLGSLAFKLFHHRARVYLHAFKVTVLGHVVSFVLIVLWLLHHYRVELARRDIWTQAPLLLSLLGQPDLLAVF
jgi:hypothetical protein